MSFLTAGEDETRATTAVFGVSSDVTDVIVSKIRQVLQEGFEIQMLFLDESEHHITEPEYKPYLI